MKTIKIFFSFIALFFTLTSNAQLSQWWISAADGNPGSKIATDQWDNVYTTVTSAGLVFATGDTALAQGSSVFVYKQNSAGNLVWVKSFSALINGAGSGAIKTDANGFIYITGGGASMQLDSFIVNGSFIAKLNPANGNVIWAKPMPGACSDIDFDASGDIYSTFHSNSSAYFDTVWVVNNWGVGKGVGVGKMDNNGKVQWVKIYHALGATDNATAIAVNSAAGKVAFTGYFTSSLDVNGTMLTSTPQTTYIVELNTANGSNSLVKKAGGKVAEDLLYDNYGNILQTGSFKGTSIFGSISLTSKGNNDIFISKWSAAGAIQFVKQIGGTGANSQNMLAGAIGVDGFNNIFLGGRMCETNIMDADTLTAEGASDAFLAKYNSSGVLQWSQPFHGNGDWEAIEDMKVKSDGNIFITGRFDYNYIHLSNDSVYSVCNCNTTNVFTAKLAGYANKISGHLFVDFNSNGIKDTADFFVKNEKVTIAPLPGLVFTDTSGYYETFVDTGNFTVTSLYSHPYYYPSPASHIITNNLLNQVYDSLDFALQPTYNITDVSVDVTDMSIPRIYKPQYFRITYTNNGTDTVNGTVSLVLDQQLNFSISVPPTSTINGNTLTWNYFNLNPFETRIINAEANFNILTPLGSIAQVSTSITPFITDTIKTNNSDSLLLTVLSALDPNFKEVSPSANISPDFVQNQNELTYTIHFQNTGNDTAFNISIADTISANLNLNSIRIISSSHTCQLNASSNSKRAEFIFNDILLPDSNINEPMSHGFVKYAIKPLNSLIVGDSINNTAYIYFDFNAAVITNTCVTKVSEPLSIRGVKTNIENINIYPNPGTGLYHINFSSNTNSLKTVEVFSLLGDKIISFATKNNSVVIDLSKQPQGIYMLRVNDAENTFTGKLIRQ